MQLLIVRIIQGFANGFVPAAMAVVASSTPKDKMGFCIGVMQTTLFIVGVYPAINRIVRKQWLVIQIDRKMEEGISMSREKRLDQKMLVSNIKRICSNMYKELTVSELTHKGGPRHRIEIEADGLEFYVDFHFKANGSTSIDISTGHHFEQKKKIMAAILSDPSCLLVDAGK